MLGPAGAERGERVAAGWPRSQVVEREVVEELVAEREAQAGVALTQAAGETPVVGAAVEGEPVARAERGGPVDERLEPAHAGSAAGADEPGVDAVRIGDDLLEPPLGGGERAAHAGLAVAVEMAGDREAALRTSA